MTIGLSTTVRNNRLTQIVNAIDGGAGNGTLKIYDGTRPATGGTATTLLGTLTFSKPCGAVAAGVLTFSAITSDTSADATSTATWARIADSTGTFVLDCSVGTSGSDINLNTVSIVTGAQISVTSASITAGNP
jgi:hypothetical protein